MPVRKACSVFAICLLAGPATSAAQSLPTDDAVVERIWAEGMENSRTRELAQVLMDSIGPRLAGSPGFDAAVDWLLATYAGWGVPARKEEYGTWTGWRQGVLHVDLVSPRVQTLEAELLAFSVGTEGPTEGPVVTVPADLTEDNAPAWLATIAGKFVLASPPEPMCRARQELEANARKSTVEALDSVRLVLQRDYAARLRELGGWRRAGQALEDAGAAGIVMSYWSGGWGVNKIFNAPTRGIPALDLSCEDYGMLFRMTEAGQSPRIRVEAESEDLGEVPQFNVIAELRGTELPEEYVVLGAHLDSWHAATGATDNGTGTITMLEAMRLLKEAYPNPRRTIIAGHWGAEEMGLIGSRAFVEDHPEVLEGLQVAFNQDNGTWRIERIEGQGFLGAGAHIARWMALVPSEISGHVTLEFPGAQNNGGSDHSSFVCAGAPAFRLQSSYDEYRQYTWHTNRDTYDKIVFDDLKENATLAAMLAYAASEDPERVPRDRAILPIDPNTGEPRPWMRCGTARRSP
ncbi:MAG: M20/M25/M40 family metallo-hydrolase [Candidatus Palauibacterales bacterium]|nr:M20/M25/M40 family metallo-hydrolase [Candidatus Palauibacterales bacterium]MDP2482387.1 M20/M25/M40 family metallo-hydrolase [Candidatus Palauibacterales bacterium]